MASMTIAKTGEDTVAGERRKIIELANGDASVDDKHPSHRTPPEEPDRYAAVDPDVQKTMPSRRTSLLPLNTKPSILRTAPWDPLLPPAADYLVRIESRSFQPPLFISNSNQALLSDLNRLPQCIRPSDPGRFPAKSA
ncbi:hypothetical protein BST61_g11487 [Cercospora zeina]